LPAVTLPNARKLLQTGTSALPEAEVKPVLETIDQPVVPDVPPMLLIGVRDGLATVTEQPGDPGRVIVCWPPGQFSKVATGELVTLKVSVEFDGQLLLVLQVMWPLVSTPVTNPPLGHDWPLRPAPGEPCGPAGSPQQWLYSDLGKS
jgi:hypothetical protein